ncbi:hypothetical protein [Streptomyces poonensis]|nr:hypothetical protein [Streptomyces poonensis]GLJ93870.1 hypothetical protein GCM10017589_64870 [Streptomyces poonensis]
MATRIVLSLPARRIGHLTEQLQTGTLAWPGSWNATPRSCSR